MSITSPHYAKLEQYLGARYSDNTVRAFLGQAQQFMLQLGPKLKYDRTDVLAYADFLVRHGYKETSIRAIIAGVRVLFEANGWPWELGRRALHLGLPQDEGGGPVMPASDIARLIAAGRELVAPEGPAICLSTIYGLRAAEIAAVLSAGCDGASLEVQTAKTGRKRAHAIPAELRPYLHCKARPITVDGIHRMFQRVMRRWVRPTVPREGWHAIRRALVTGLLDGGLPEFKLHLWMGWRAPGNKIAFRYYKKDLDEDVFAKHPFLRYWEGE